MNGSGSNSLWEFTEEQKEWLHGGTGVAPATDLEVEKAQQRWMIIDEFQFTNPDDQEGLEKWLQVLDETYLNEHGDKVRNKDLPVCDVKKYYSFKNIDNLKQLVDRHMVYGHFVWTSDKGGIE